MAQKLVYVLLIGVCLLQYQSANWIHWSDSEIWPIALAGTNSEISAHASQNYKLVFNQVNQLSHELSESNIASLEFGRLIYCLIGLASLGLCLAISRKLQAGPVAQLACLLLIGSSSLFLHQGFRIRSDLLSAFFQLCALLSLLALSQVRNTRILMYIAIPAFHLLALLSTPKAIYHLMINFCFFIPLYKSFVGSSRLRLSCIHFLLPLLLVIAWGSWQSSSYFSAFDYFMQSWAASPFRPFAYSLEGFVHLNTLVEQNPHIFFLASVAILARAFRSEGWTPLDVGALSALVGIFLHSERLPFFILSMSWVIFIWIAHNLSFLFTGSPMKSLRILTTVTCAALIWSGFGYWRQSHLQNSNLNQRKTIGIIESLISTHPNLNHYDGLGALPKARQILLGPSLEHPGSEREITDLIRSGKIDLVLFSNRLHYFYAGIMRALEDAVYLRIGPGLFARSEILATAYPALVESAQLELMCKKFKYSSSVYFYSANSMMENQVLAAQWSCGGPDLNGLKFDSESSYLLASGIQPIALPEGLEFSQIFDDDSGLFIPFKNRFTY